MVEDETAGANDGAVERATSEPAVVEPAVVELVVPGEAVEPAVVTSASSISTSAAATADAASSFFREAYLCLVTSCLLFAFRVYSRLRLPRVDIRHETEGSIISWSCLLPLPVWIFAPTNVRTYT